MNLKDNNVINTCDSCISDSAIHSEIMGIVTAALVLSREKLYELYKQAVCMQAYNNTTPQKTDVLLSRKIELIISDLEILHDDLVDYEANHNIESRVNKGGV